MIEDFLNMAFPAIALLSLLVYLPVYCIKRRRYGRRPWMRHLALYALIGTVLSVLYATIFAYGWAFLDAQYHFLNLTPFVWLQRTYEMGMGRMIEQLLLNIAMMIPLGFLLPVVFRSLRRWWRSGLWVMALSACIEVAQYFIGRSADIDDLLMNVLGGLIGYLVAALLHRRLGNKRWWRRLCNEPDGQIEGRQKPPENPQG